MSDLYKLSGVDIDAGGRTVDLMAAAVRSTFTPSVLADVGSFGGLFALDALPADAVLVASTDGVGTKVMLAAAWNRWQGLGHDIVNHCANDILVQNGRPLFFLDYVAAAKLTPERVATIVAGMADACRVIGCALLGGETAEMPGVYSEGALDIAGTIVGVVGRREVLPRPESMRPGDLLLGLPSSGPHTNGYSLIRRAVAGLDLSATLDDGQTLLDALLAPHRCYIHQIDLLRDAGVPLRGMAHITGGGLVDNLPRILPDALAAQIDVASWQVPPVFRMLIDRSGMDEAEAFRVFNMGIGMILVLAPDVARRALSTLPEAVQIGVLRPRHDEAVVLMRGRR